MDEFYEEDDQIVGHAADPYHRIDIRRPDKIEVYLDDTRLHPEPGQTVLPHGADRNLTPEELAHGASS